MSSDPDVGEVLGTMTANEFILGLKTTADNSLRESLRADVAQILRYVKTKIDDRASEGYFTVEGMDFRLEQIEDRSDRKYTDDALGNATRAAMVASGFAACSVNVAKRCAGRFVLKFANVSWRQENIDKLMQIATTDSWRGNLSAKVILGEATPVEHVQSLYDKADGKVSQVVPRVLAAVKKEVTEAAAKGAHHVDAFRPPGYSGACDMVALASKLRPKLRIMGFVDSEVSEDHWCVTIDNLKWDDECYAKVPPDPVNVSPERTSAAVSTTSCSTFGDDI
eukprot:gene1041-993_t